MKNIFWTIVLLVTLGSGMFIFNQILVPEVGADLAIAQVTEDASGAGVRATNNLVGFINVIAPLITIFLIFMIWYNKIREVWKKYLLDEKF